MLKPHRKTSQKPSPSRKTQPSRPIPSRHPSRPSRRLHGTKPSLNPRKRWAVTWGLSAINGLGRESDVLYDPHPQRILLPSLSGESYCSYNREFSLVDDIPEEGVADVAQVAVGWSTNMALTAEGRVFQWGFRAPTRSMVKRALHNQKLGTKIGNFFENVVGYHPWSGGSPKPIRIACFGAENDAQLWEEAEKGKMELPKWMTAQRMKPVKIDTASDNRGVLTAGGHLFTWSEVGDIHGSIGQGKEYSTSPEPRLIPIPDIIDFSFGYNHLSFISAHGTLYSCGNTDGGATGLPMAYTNLNAKKKRIYRPISVHTNYEKFMSDIKEATKVHTVSSSNSTDPTSSNTPTGKSPDSSVPRGNNAEYDIKLGKTTKKIDLEGFTDSSRGFIPKKLSPGGFGKQNSNSSHEEMRLTGHELLANVVQFVNWRGVEGREGSCDPVNALANNEIPLVLPRFKSVSCGFAHTLVIDEEGGVWSHGRNAHGELGHTLNPFNDDGRGNVKSHVTNDGMNPVDFRTFYYPTRLKTLSHLKAIKVSAGLHHSAVLMTNGEIYTFGNNSYGQCGRLNELPSTLRSLTVGHKQPWALPPGKLYISPNVLNGSRVIDVVCGFYDTAITLSDGRCLMAGGYLSKEGHPRSLFSLAEFDPIVKKIQNDGQNDENNDENNNENNENDSYQDSEEYTTESDDGDNSSSNHLGGGLNTWIQSIPSRDMIPRSMYSEMYEKEIEKISQGLREKFTLTSDSHYFMKSMRFGWQHGVATAIPRSITDMMGQGREDGNDNVESSDNNDDNNNTDPNNNNTTPIDNNKPNSDALGGIGEVDISLLFSQEAKEHQDVAEASYNSGAFDTTGADPNPFKSLQSLQNVAMKQQIDRDEAEQREANDIIEREVEERKK